MKFYSCDKYLISSFFIAACCLQQFCWGQSTTVRPYKFGFTIDEQQHRREMRDERGIVMGEYGFITADGIYHVTVYATDEQGRFRILAMKNYPYESPPKTVEVMVQPKAAPVTTTKKPLPKYNFNTQACSGCFLANGNNKPKGSNEIEEKTSEIDIRVSSKNDFPIPNENSAANPNTPNNTPSTGEQIVSKNAKSLVTLKANQNINTPIITAPQESVIVKDLNALENVAVSQHLYTTTFTPAPKTILVTYTNAQHTQDLMNSEKAHSEFGSKPKTSESNESEKLLHMKTALTDSLNTADEAAVQSTRDGKELTPRHNASHTDFSRLSTIASSKEANITAASSNIDVTTYQKPTNRTVVTNMITIHTNSYNQLAKNLSVQEPVKVAKTTNTNAGFKGDEQTYMSAPNNSFMRSSINFDNRVAATPAVSKSNKDFIVDSADSTEKDITDDETNTKHPDLQINDQNKPLNTLEMDAQPQEVSNNAAHNAPHNAPHNVPHNVPHNLPYNVPHNLPHKELQNQPLPMVNYKKEFSSHTSQSKQDYNQNPVKTKANKSLEFDYPVTTNISALENTISKLAVNYSNTITNAQSKFNLPNQSTPTTHPALSSNPATLNTNFQSQSTQTAPIKNLFQYKHTTIPAVDKVLNPKSTASTAQGGSTASSTSQTSTGNLPPMMEIIMQEILPTLMGKKGQTNPLNPSQTTASNNKPNALPSNQKPGSSNAGVDVATKSAGGSGSRSANDDADLYRFKYILDYHGHTETGKRNGNKEGSYFVIGDDNVERSIEYVANELGYQPRIRWRKLDSNEIKPKENTLKDYEFVWFHK